MSNKTVAIVGYGVVGTAYHKMFPDAVIYDEPKDMYQSTTKPQYNDPAIVNDNGLYRVKATERTYDIEHARTWVNSCDVAIVAVWTGLMDNGELDCSIVEEVVEWIECPLIIIKSALQPGVTDRLVEKTGKRIAVSTEFIGEGDYQVPYWKVPHQSDPRLHQMLIVGGEEDAAEEAAQVLWRKMSPDIKIHKLTALEAEIVKLIENFYGALRVTFANTFLSLAQKSKTSYIRENQAWQSDPRVDSFHLRAVEFQRGWSSRCWDKDIIALKTYAVNIGASDMAELANTIIELNKQHLAMNDESKAPSESPNA